MIREAPCTEVEPLLFALLEDEVDDGERERLTAHLRRCGACRRRLEQERELTHALAPAALRAAARSDGCAVGRRRIAWPLAAAAVLGVGLGIAVLSSSFGGRTAYGSIAPARYEPTLRLANGVNVALASHNHVVVPAAENDTIELLATGTLRVAGPAVIELDRAPETWKLVLLRGQVAATLLPGARLRVSSVHGARTLDGGVHLITMNPAWYADTAAAQEATPAELLQSGYTQFFQRADMASAEAAFRAAWKHPKATEEEQGRALFYLWSSVGRQERYDDAVALQTEWMKLHPDDPSYDYVLLFQGVYLRESGHEPEARAAWDEIVRRAKDEDLSAMARAYLGGTAATTPGATQGKPRARESVDRYVPDRLLPDGAGQVGTKVVVAYGLDPKNADHARFRKIAEKAVARDHAAFVDCADADFERLSKALRELLPEAVLFVLPPEALDVKLHRQVVLLSRSLDEDVFPDFTFGWFTARDGKSAEALWERTCETREKGLASKVWTSTFVTSGMKSCEYPNYGLDVVAAAGFERKALAFATRESDPAVLDFVHGNLKRLADAGVVSMTGNGDPQGIWLFDDARNADPKTHWPFDPARVGSDPKGEMPRILAAEFRKLELDRPVVWSGTCHSAATHRVFVEGDIVSTFGSSERTELYEMPLAESMGLSILDAGAVALLAPIGANHGYAVDLETEFALENGASLGEIVKSTWDDVFLQARGELTLVLPVAGGPPTYAGEPIMQGGGVNRVLLGDPTLRPFRATAVPRERTIIRAVRDAKSERSFDVVVEWDKGFHTRGWNLYSAKPTTSRRIAARVRLDDLLPAHAAARLAATLRVVDGKGEALEGFVLTHAEPEVFHGHRFLHLQANAPDKVLDETDVRATFSVTWRPVEAR
ncbi:MAG TPA: zf-HC2 domain-containing protein [Planctomycetota bacterium]|nr:zf-HC2 domain-containing protein [Planctomycetota bacterium]